MNKIFYIILIIALLGASVYFFTKEKEIALIVEPDSAVTTDTEYVSYKSSEYSPELTYPRSWGEVTLKSGNKVCPEEDTYRTSDTLHVFDWEFSFPEIKLPGSESMIRTGVRTYFLDPKKLNDCGDDFHQKIASKEVDPPTISSFRLTPITTPHGLSGTYNENASRLNTEARIQYTYFVPQIGGTYLLQPYMSFIPHFGSPELIEMEQDFAGDMTKYLAEGKTAEPIRNHIKEFKKMAESILFAGE